MTSGRSLSLSGLIAMEIQWTVTFHVCLAVLMVLCVNVTLTTTSSATYVLTATALPATLIPHVRGVNLLHPTLKTTYVYVWRDMVVEVKMTAVANVIRLVKLVKVLILKIA